MTNGFDVDGFSKMSKVHASKKPLTVAKAPSFGRTTSRAGQTTTSGADSLRKDSLNKNTQSVKPTQTSRAGTPARVPRTATPTQSSSRASKAATPLQNKVPVTSPKHTASARRLTSTSTQNGVQSSGSEKAASELDTHEPGEPDEPGEPNEPGEPPANDNHSKDEKVIHFVSSAKYLPRIAVKDGEIQDLKAEIQTLQTTKHAENQKLNAQINDIQTANEHKIEETKAAFLAQIESLESEVDVARQKISKLEANQHKTQEEHNRILNLKDEEIQKLSGTAQGRRGEQEPKESELSLKDQFQRLKTQHKRELDEAAAAASAEVEAFRAEHHESLQSRDQEIKEMSDLVQELQEKVEKAHQADKDELKEAKQRHEQQTQDRVEQHGQELRDATTRFEELQEKVQHHERELRDAAAKHVQEMNDEKEERQTILRDTTQRHEQESRDTASKYQQEVEDLMLTHHAEIKTARTWNEQASSESAAKHQQEIEALIVKHREELGVATARQEQAIRNAAAKHQQESQSLEAKHLEELRSATKKDEQESGTLVTKHEQEIQAMTAKHQEELGEIITTNEQGSGNAAIKSQQAIEAIITEHREELASATSQIEELRAVNHKHQQELGDKATNHVQEIERVSREQQQELRGMSTKYDQELEEAKAKYKELEDVSLKRETEAARKHEETAQLRNQLETAISKVASLETTLRDLNLQTGDSGREASSKEQELRTATLKYEEEVQSLQTIYATAVEEITALRRALQDVEQKQSEAVEEELQSLRTIYATAVEEITALRRKVENVDQKRSEAVDEAASLKASREDLDLKRSEAVGQLVSLQGIMKDEELERSEVAVGLALLRDKLELADRRFEQDQQAVSDLQRQNRELQAQVAELSTDTNLDRSEAAVDVALLKDKLELADLEIHLHKGTISALQNETERLQTQLADQSADLSLGRDEAVVDVALLKDKLELADIQIRQAKGTVSNLQEEIEGLKAQITNSTIGMDLDQNEAAVEIALLKNTLELANLESHQDKATITTLQKQIEGLQAHVADTPKTGSNTSRNIRQELSTLGRHQAAQMTDLESLKADMAAESESREQGWKQRADVFDRFASELQGMNTRLVETMAGSSRAVSIE